MNLTGLTTSTEVSNIIGIQGEPNSGKTTAALSFPNPIVLDFDKKLPVGTRCIPFWNDTFVDSLKQPRLHPAVANRRDAITAWLAAHVATLPPDVTLIVDSWTAVQDTFDQAFYHAPAQPRYITKGSVEIDKFKVYQHKIDWSVYLFQLLKAAACPVIITFHEQIERDKQGDPTGKMRTLMSGQFADRIGAMCSLFVRQDVTNERGKPPVYTWQIKSDSRFKAIVNPIYRFPDEATYIDITKGAYAALEKYRVAAAK